MTFRVPHTKRFTARKIKFMNMNMYGSAHTDSEQASEKDLKIVRSENACTRWFL